MTKSLMAFEYVSFELRVSVVESDLRHRVHKESVVTTQQVHFSYCHSELTRTNSPVTTLKILIFFDPDPATQTRGSSVSMSTDHATLLREESSWKGQSARTQKPIHGLSLHQCCRHTSGSSSTVKTSRLLVLEVADLRTGLHM